MTSYQCYVLHVEVNMYVRLWSSPFTEVTCDRDTIHTLTRHWTISMNISCFYVCNLVIKFPSGVLIGFLLDLHSLLIMFYCLQTAAVVWHIKHKLLMFRCWHSYITPTSCEEKRTSESSTRSPAADVQMCRVWLCVEQVDVQMKRLVLACVSPPPHRLLVPDVVKHVELRQEKMRGKIRFYYHLLITRILHLKKPRTGLNYCNVTRKSPAGLRSEGPPAPLSNSICSPLLWMFLRLLFCVSYVAYNVTLFPSLPTSGFLSVLIGRSSSLASVFF